MPVYASLCLRNQTLDTEALCVSPHPPSPSHHPTHTLQR